MKSVEVSAENSFPYYSLLQRNITAQKRHVLAPVVLRLISSRKVMATLFVCQTCCVCTVTVKLG